jgi:hypothetical protein
VALVAAATAGLLSGCAQQQKREVGSVRLDLPEGMVALALDVTNFNGSVTVRANSDQDSVLVESRRFASVKDGADRATAALDKIELSADLEADGPRGVLRIASASAHDQPDAHGVDLVVKMPRCDGVQIRNAGGHVSVTDAGGTVDIYNEGGSIEFRTSRRMTEDVALITHEGEVYYQIPLGSTGDFDMLTLDGRTTLIDRGAVVKDTYVGRGELQFVLNDGTNSVVLRTNRGSVRTWIMENPLELTRARKRDKPDYRDRLYLDGSRRYTRNLSGDAERRGAPSVRINAAPWNRGAERRVAERAAEASKAVEDAGASSDHAGDGAAE